MLGTDVRVKSESVENVERKKFLLYVSPVVLGSSVISSYKSPGLGNILWPLFSPLSISRSH